MMNVVHGKMITCCINILLPFLYGDLALVREVSIRAIEPSLSLVQAIEQLSKEREREMQKIDVRSSNEQK